MQDLKDYIVAMAAGAKKASVSLRTASAAAKNAALDAIGRSIDSHRAIIKEANGLDVDAAKKAGLSSAMVDRLTLTDRRIDDIIRGLREIASFEDPVGGIEGVRRPSGFTLEKVRTPIGVIVMIYESRPNVTVDAAALCLKSGNAVILR
ncbi:MAG TPA: gamma-glutamyl-phosphate reductase, partial [Spirochaetia bacterium]